MFRSKQFFLDVLAKAGLTFETEPAEPEGDLSVEYTRDEVYSALLEVVREDRRFGKTIADRDNRANQLIDKIQSKLN